MDWQLCCEMSLGGISTLLAFGVEIWLRRHPNRAWLLVVPGIWLLCLGIGSAIATRTIGEHPIIVMLTYLAIALGGCRLAFIIAPNRNSALAAVGFIFGVAVLTFFELREPFLTYLESFTITVADTKLSLLKLLEAITMIVVMFWITRAFHHWLAIHIRKMKNVDPSVQEWLVKLSELTLYFIVLASGLYILGIDITSVAVFGGAVGVGLGFGLQKIVSNYMSGLILLFEKTVKIGDVIELEGGPSGQVYRFDPRGTFILCPDGKEVIIPNEEFITKKVTNWTFSHKKGQISVPVGVAYGSDVEKVKELLLEAAREHPLCLTTPEPSCYLTEFGSYSTHMLLQFWIDDVTPGIIGPQSDVMFAILRKFKQAGIEIPVLSFIKEGMINGVNEK